MSALATHELSDASIDVADSLSAANLIDWASRVYGDALAVSTSFGIQSAVTLRLAKSVRPDIPVIWIDTGYLPEETLRYADTLTRRLDLNLHVYRSRMTPSEMEQLHGKLWESERVEDLNLYDQIRKVEPMDRALRELDISALVSGLRREQTNYRSGLPNVRRSGSTYRIYPILDWTSREVYRFMKQYDLPQHPLFDRGYLTVGDKHSSRPFLPGDDSARDTRFRGLKQECGLHL